MQINVLLFAAAREAAGRDSIAIDVSEGASASQVIEELANRLPEIAPLLVACRLAADCEYVASDTAIHADQEIALIPPVSGG